MFVLPLIIERFFFVYLRVMSSSNFPPPLAPEEERELFLRARSGDGAAREKLIEHNLRLVAHIVKKYYTSCRDAEDLVSIGTIGLIKAIDTFNPEKGARFATYAGKCLQNEILMHFRATKRLASETGLSDAIEYDREGNELTYYDVISEQDDVVEIVEQKCRAQEVHRAVREALTKREREIVVLRYGLAGKEPLTQREVASHLGISRSYVSRIEKGALSKIRKHLGERVSFS